MAYDIAGNLQSPDFVGNFLAGQRARQQNTLFDQQQQDRVAQQQAAQAQAQQAQQQEHLKWAAQAAQNLEPLIANPEQFNRTADVFASEAAQRGIPLKREEITPEAVTGLLAQLRTRAGIAPPKPTAADVPDYGLGNVNPGDYTPESVQAYVQSVDPRTGRGNFSLLKKQYAPQQAWIGQMAGGIGAIPRTAGGVGAPTMVVAPDANIAGNARAAGAEAAAKEAGQAQGTAVANLPTIENQAKQTTDLIDRLIAHPGLKGNFGIRGVAPNVPGSDASNFAAELDQLKGQVFLAAYSQLKGGGAITEPEGRKAEQAIAALNNAQSAEAVVLQLKRLKAVLDTGVATARRKAGQGASAAPGAPAASGVIRLNGGATLERLP